MRPYLVPVSVGLTHFHATAPAVNNPPRPCRAPSPSTSTSIWIICHLPFPAVKPLSRRQLYQLARRISTPLSLSGPQHTQPHGPAGCCKSLLSVLTMTSVLKLLSAPLMRPHPLHKPLQPQHVLPLRRTFFRCYSASHFTQAAYDVEVPCRSSGSITLK